MHIVQGKTAAHTPRLVRRSVGGVTIPVVVVIAVLVAIAIISFIRIVKKRERALKPTTSYMAAANPILRVRKYEAAAPEPKRPRTPPALRPRHEFTYVRRPTPARTRGGSVQPTPPLYQSQAGTPSAYRTGGDVPILEMPVSLQAPSGPAVAGNDPPPPYKAPVV